MRCPVCNGHMKKGTWNNHHLWFPKHKFFGTRRGDLTIPIHITCHNRFHYKYLHYCLNKKECQNCQFTRVCVYNQN